MPMSDEHFDIAVIGGGPAGTSAAITAARFGAKVAIFEARNFPRHKVCGEFISAEALGVLAVLLDGSENESRLADVAPAISRTRIFLGRRTIEAKIRPAAVSIARYDLDAALWRVAQKTGVDTRANSEISSVFGDGPFQIATSSGSCVAKAVVI